MVLHLVFPMDQEGHAGTHQQDRAHHPDVTPFRFTDRFQDFAGQQEVQSGGDACGQDP